MKRLLSERIGILEKCVFAIWRELADYADYGDVVDYLERLTDDLRSARHVLENAGL